LRLGASEGRPKHLRRGREEKPDLQEGVSGRGGRKVDVDTDETKTGESLRARQLKVVEPGFTPPLKAA
jgi:hypothetical protein